MAWRIFRSSAWAQVAPKSPVEAPMTATGLLRRTLVAIGLEIQSRAFFSAPGTDALYSGVANRSASVGPGDLMAHHAQRGNVIAAGTGVIVLIKRWHRLDHDRIEHNELDAGR
jgi:hypothetical protein